MNRVQYADANAINIASEDHEDNRWRWATYVADLIAIVLALVLVWPFGASASSAVGFYNAWIAQTRLIAAAQSASLP